MRSLAIPNFHGQFVPGDCTNQKKLADVVDLLLARKGTFDADTTVRMAVSGTEIDAFEIKEKIRYTPSEKEK
jgi:hypothetical protein